VGNKWGKGVSMLLHAPEAICLLSREPLFECLNT
jgi:hypothetical protein